MDKTIWQEYIETISSGGMSYSAIAAAVNSHTSTIGDLASGRSKEPRGMTAILLSELHAKEVRKQARASRRAKAA